MTPADQGIIAAAIDDATRQGLGDDGITDTVADALVFAGWPEREADRTAGLAVHRHFHG